MTSISKKTIRNCAYAAVLTISALSFSPSLAAQDEGGSFKLPTKSIGKTR